MDILYEDLKGPAEAWSLVNPFVEAHKVDYPILMGDDGITKRYSIKLDLFGSPDNHLPVRP